MTKSTLTAALLALVMLLVADVAVGRAATLTARRRGTQLTAKHPKNRRQPQKTPSNPRRSLWQLPR